MRSVLYSRYSGRGANGGNDDLDTQLAERIVGQPTATASIVPYVRMYQAGLAPEGRPVGVFLLLGPSGTGKTRTVEALASVLHGNEKNLLRIDCGEFQMEHEVAKLIGAPPGYLGHRETQPLLTQSKLNAITSERSSISIVLFDEIEKAASSMSRLLLGVLDKASLRLGDNNTVNFERCLIFMTSNLGAREMQREITPDFGFQAAAAAGRSGAAKKLESIGMQALRRRFAPEFINRIDSVITYRPLERDSLRVILGHHLAALQTHITARLGSRAFTVQVSERASDFLIDQGTSSHYGARELKRTILRHLTQPIATLVATGKTGVGGLLRAELARDRASLKLSYEPPPEPEEDPGADGPFLVRPVRSRRSLFTERKPPKAA